MKNESNVIYQAIGFTLWTLLAMFLGAVLVEGKPCDKCAEQFNTVVEAQITSNYDRMTTAGVTMADSIAFEYLFSKANNVDMPEEYPVYGDTMCAYVLHDTIFIEHYHGYDFQDGLFRYVHGE